MVMEKYARLESLASPGSIKWLIERLKEEHTNLHLFRAYQFMNGGVYVDAAPATEKDVAEYGIKHVGVMDIVNQTVWVGYHSKWKSGGKRFVVKLSRGYPFEAPRVWFEGLVHYSNGRIARNSRACFTPNWKPWNSIATVLDLLAAYVADVEQRVRPLEVR